MVAGCDSQVRNQYMVFVQEWLSDRPVKASFVGSIPTDHPNLRKYRLKAGYLPRKEAGRGATPLACAIYAPVAQ